MGRFATSKLLLDPERKFLKFIKEALGVDNRRAACAVLGFILVTQYAAIAVFLRGR